MKVDYKIFVLASLIFAVSACGKSEQAAKGEATASENQSSAQATQVVDGFKDIKFGMSISDLLKMQGCVDGMELSKDALSAKAKKIDDYVNTELTGSMGDQKQIEAQIASYRKLQAVYENAIQTGDLTQVARKKLEDGETFMCNDTFMGNKVAVHVKFDNDNKANLIQAGITVPTTDKVVEVIKAFDSKYHQVSGPSVSAIIENHAKWEFANGQVKVEINDLAQSSLGQPNLVNMYGNSGYLLVANYWSSAFLNSKNAAAAKAKNDL